MTGGDPILVGVDGGATKVSAWQVLVEPGPTFRLGDRHAEYAYRDLDGFDADFEPVDLAEQLRQREAGEPRPTEAEIRQGKVWIEAAARAVAETAGEGGGAVVKIGIGLPGLKTPDRRGLNAVANGPRIPDYCDRLESRLREMGIRLAAPIRELGSDADYCGIGEEYAADGAFRPVRNAYYLGGGTGVADALKLRGRVTPFDAVRDWIAKTWEMKDDEGESFEASTSARGIRALYARLSGEDPEELERRGVYLAQIARRAREGDRAARETVRIAGSRLAQILAERIETLAAGSSGGIGFVNPARAALRSDHPYLGERFDRLVLGQRLGEVWADPEAGAVYRESTLPALAERIVGCGRIGTEIKAHYPDAQGRFREERLVASSLREAPALGAAAAAWLADAGE